MRADGESGSRSGATPTTMELLLAWLDICLAFAQDGRADR
jgi:hypothetical protein